MSLHLVVWEQLVQLSLQLFWLATSNETTRYIITQGPVTVASSQRVGRVIDLSWAPLPQPVGGGAVVALALEDGSLAFADTSQAVEHSSCKQRMQAFKHLLGGSWPYPQVSLSCFLHFCLCCTQMHVIH